MCYDIQRREKKTFDVQGNPNDTKQVNMLLILQPHVFYSMKSDLPSQLAIIAVNSLNAFGIS